MVLELVYVVDDDVVGELIDVAEVTVVLELEIVVELVSELAAVLVVELELDVALEIEVDESTVGTEVDEVVTRAADDVVRVEDVTPSSGRQVPIADPNGA